MKSWYYTDNGQLYGPFQDKEMQGFIKDASLTPDTLVWNNGPGDAERGWVRAAETELFALFNDHERLVSQTPPPVYSSNFYEYKSRQRQFEQEEKPRFRYVKYSVAALLFAVILIAGLTLLNNAFYRNRGGDNSLIDNPSAEAVKTAIQQINTITEIGIATEENDPNRQLGKRGGYTGCLFFIDKNAPETDGADAIEKGTDGGGCIEIYARAADAKKRDKYLASFDGTLFASGSHTVVGTLVVRTSSEMTASQQKTLEAQLIDVLNGKRPSGPVYASKENAAQPAPAVSKPAATKVKSTGWKTETYGRITFKIDSSWEKELGDDGDCYYSPPISESPGFIKSTWGERSLGNLSDEEARSRLDGGISGMMGNMENAEEINRAYFKIGDKYAARVNFYFDIDDGTRGRADVVNVLFEDGYTLLFSLLTTSAYESYKDIIETTLSSVALEQRPAQPPITASKNTVNPNFKKTMDSYEAFFDQYVAFMKRYQNSNNSIAMFTDYLDFMTKYADAMEKLDEIDSDKLSTADSLYYIEVQSRISKKLLEAAAQ